MNLTQAIALKCLTDVSLQTAGTSTASTESVAGVLDAYFEGCKLYTVSGARTEVFPYAYSNLAAMKDVFALHFLLKQLRSTHNHRHIKKSFGFFRACNKIALLRLRIRGKGLYILAIISHIYGKELYVCRVCLIRPF